MEIIKVKTKALNYIKTVFVVPYEYENGSLYIGLYDTVEQELYTDLSTYILPVLHGQFYVEKGSEQQRFVEEQKQLFTNLEREVKHILLWQYFILTYFCKLSLSSRVKRRTFLFLNWLQKQFLSRSHCSINCQIETIRYV